MKNVLIVDDSIAVSRQLEKIVNSLVELYGWDELGKRIDINCFNVNPSVKSSLKFLRRTPWARTQVEELFLAMKNHDR